MIIMSIQTQKMNPNNILDTILYRQKLSESGALFKTPHRCSNCNNEFDCGNWNCDENEGIFCSIECSMQYN